MLRGVGDGVVCVRASAIAGLAVHDMGTGMRLTGLIVCLGLWMTASAANAANFMTRDHLVVDLRHGIEWLRCSVGQVWDGTGCVGKVLNLNHEEIELAIKQANEQLGGSWRLPNREELEGLVCETCPPPLIDRKVFPDTSAEPYWTGQVNGMAKRHYFSVNFFNGWTYGRFFPTQQLAVRLVRDRY